MIVMNKKNVSAFMISLLKNAVFSSKSSHNSENKCLIKKRYYFLQHHLAFIKNISIVVIKIFTENNN